MKLCASEAAGFSTKAGDCDDANDLAYPGKTLPCGQCGTKTCKTDNSGAWTACAGVLPQTLPCQTCGTQSCQADGTWGSCAETKGIYYFDGDDDGWGAGPAVIICASEAADFSTKAGDCDDGKPAVNPDEREDCNTPDNDDCDDKTNESSSSEMAVGCAVYYPDSDKDGFGAEGQGDCLCNKPTGWVTSGTDCYDKNANANPGPTTYYDVHRGDGSFDYDCDGNETRLYGLAGGCSIVKSPATKSPGLCSAGGRSAG